MSGRAGTGLGEDCPYRGLVPFGEGDSHVFYGRERDHRPTGEFLVTAAHVRGAAGSYGRVGGGKIVLAAGGAAAGDRPRRTGEPARNWPRHVIEEPTRSPLARLATLLAPMAGLEATAVLDSLTSTPELAHLLVRQAVDTDAQRRGLSAIDAAAARLVLVVDQFEEIFNPVTGQDEAIAADERNIFITALHAAATTPCGSSDAPAALVIIAVRGDFIDRCAAHPVLASALQDGPFVVGPMNEPDLRLTITAPAAAAGLELQSGVAEAILSELRSPAGGYDAGALPLVSQTMLTVWEHREGNHLTLRGYERTGGVTCAVATGAEAAYINLSEPAQGLTRRVFLQLSGVSPTGRLVRRTAARTEVYAEVHRRAARPGRRGPEHLRSASAHRRRRRYHPDRPRHLASVMATTACLAGTRPNRTRAAQPTPRRRR